MCKSIEEYAEQRAAKALEQGMEKGMLQATVNSIKSAMGKADMSAEKAMELIGVPKADFAKYLTLL